MKQVNRNHTHLVLVDDGGDAHAPAHANGLPASLSVRADFEAFLAQPNSSYILAEEIVMDSLQRQSLGWQQADTSPSHKPTNSGHSPLSGRESGDGRMHGGKGTGAKVGQKQRVHTANDGSMRVISICVNGNYLTFQRVAAMVERGISALTHSTL
jgi:hypothetical protein